MWETFVCKYLESIRSCFSSIKSLDTLESAFSGHGSNQLIIVLLTRSEKSLHCLFKSSQIGEKHRHTQILSLHLLIKARQKLSSVSSCPLAITYSRTESICYSFSYEFNKDGTTSDVKMLLTFSRNDSLTTCESVNKNTTCFLLTSAIV